MKRSPGRTVIAVVGTGAMLALGGFLGSASPAGGNDGAAAHVVVPTDSASLATGAKLFKANCVPCHGVSGRGDGPTGVTLKPRPRNFTHPQEFKSKNDDEIFAVISRG